MPGDSSPDNAEDSSIHIAKSLYVGDIRGRRGTMADALRIGIVGCAEHTHGKVWGNLLASEAGARYGMRPVAVWDRDHRAAEALAKVAGAKVVSRPDEAGTDVDGVMITESMPDRYLALSKPFIERGMRVFLNRPFAGSMADAHEIVRLSERHGAKIYSASALYHTQAGQKAREMVKTVEPIRLFSVTGASDHLGFYLPHAIAAMVSVLGTGVRIVRAMSLKAIPEDPQRAAAPVVVYIEYAPEARLGPVRGTVNMIGPAATWYGFTMALFGARGEMDPVHFEVTYDLLLQEMARFFRTGVEPIPREVILEKTAIFYGALASARRNGAPVEVGRLVQGHRQ